MKRNHDVHIRFSEGELKKIKAKASLLGLTTTTFIRASALSVVTFETNKTSQD